MNLAEYLSNHQYKILKEENEWVVWYGLYSKKIINPNKTETTFEKRELIFKNESLSECYAFLKCKEEKYF
jgi:hypothetical protein